MASLVSVVIPAHNAQATIARAVTSVLDQTYRPIEIIIVDDGSSDDTAAMVDAIDSDLVSLITHPTCTGAAAARNAGIRTARGEFVAFLDADDEWLDCKLARQMTMIADASSTSFIACAAHYVSAVGAVSRYPDACRPPARGSDAWKTLLAYSFIYTSGVVARRSALDMAEPFDETLVVGEDQDLWIRLARHGAVDFVDEPLIRVHDTTDSLSKRFDGASPWLILQIVQRHIADAGAALTAAERRRILGHRYARLGRNAYGAGRLGLGAWLLLRAALLGHSPAGSIAHLVIAAPPIRRLKTLIGK